MSQGLKMRHVLTVSCIGLVLTFQNCSQTPEETSDASSFESGLPFAYSAKLDTISYMSCSGMSDNPPERRGYYTIRGGAYSPITGGLAMTSEFREQTRFYSKTQRARIFALSDKNANTFLSLSVRSKANYQQPWKEGNLNAGEELDALLPPLDTPMIAGPLGASSPGQMINYFPGSHAQRLMEGSLRYYNFENTAKLTRDTLNAKEALLVLGYSTSADPLEIGLRSPVAPSGGVPTLATNRAYGSGYYLGFSLPFGYSAGEQRVLSPNGGVEELDLTTNLSQTANWDCSANYQFMVVRPEDRAAGRVNCDATPDRFNNATEQAALNAIRRVLRVEDWFVDVARKCIMPKRTGDYCYGAVQGRSIMYGVASCLNDATRMCPHFVSVCIKR